jgi:hypothetical protein
MKKGIEKLYPRIVVLKIEVVEHDFGMEPEYARGVNLADVLEAEAVQTDIRPYCQVGVVG